MPAATTLAEIIQRLRTSSVAHAAYISSEWALHDLSIADDVPALSKSKRRRQNKRHGIALSRFYRLQQLAPHVVMDRQLQHGAYTLTENLQKITVLDVNSPALRVRTSPCSTSNDEKFYSSALVVGSSSTSKVVPGSP